MASEATKLTEKADEKAEEPLFTAKHIAALMKQMDLNKPVKTVKPRSERQVSAADGKRKLFDQARSLGIELTKANVRSKTGRSPKTITELRNEIKEKEETPVY